MSYLSRLGAAIMVAALTSCASIDASNVQKFGEATSAVASAAEAARTIEDRLGREIRTEEQARQYMLGGGPYQFPPAFKATLTIGAAWNQTAAYAAALSAYGKALAAAASGVDSADLDSAADNLTKTATVLAPELAQRKGFEPASAAFGMLLKQTITQGALAHIQSIMTRTHPAIVQGRSLLESSFAGAAELADERYETWLSRKVAALNSIRKHSSGAEQYHAYRDFLAEQQQMAAAISLLVSTEEGGIPTYHALLDKMVAAHEKLSAAEPRTVGIADFVALAQQFQKIAEALKTIEEE